MAEVAGLIKCPICGREEQEIRVNKNRNLYVYCEGGCRMTYSATTSRKALPVLKSGRVYAYNGYQLRPLAVEEKSIINKPAIIIPATNMELKNDESGNNGRNSTVRRSDGQLTAAAGNTSIGEYRPSGLLGWLIGDDDDNED